ncbi:MAG TPA: universal stress protein [Gemmatimonadaceae bacterium]
MTYRRIVVATDFSDASISAAKWASQQFAPDAELILAHAVEVPHRPLFARESVPSAETIKQAMLDFATTRLEDIARFISDVPLRREIRRGRPEEVVNDLVREFDADLVVIGPHGDRPHTAKFLGTTADRIVRTSPVSVLVGTQPRHHPPRSVLVPVDDYGDVPAFLNRVRQLVGAWGARVTLLHVWSNAVYSYVASMSYAEAHDEVKASREIQNTIDRDGRRWLDELASSGFESDRAEVAIEHGKAGDETLALAGRIDPDLIVLGRRGSGLVAPAVMGSTVGTVLHGARCPVLIVTTGDYKG